MNTPISPRNARDIHSTEDGATIVGNDGSMVDLNDLLEALQSMRRGEFSARLPGDKTGLAGKVADVVNDIVAANERMARQLEHVGQVVGRDGKTRTRVRFGLSEGAWSDMETSINVWLLNPVGRLSCPASPAGAPQQFSGYPLRAQSPTTVLSRKTRRQ